MPLLSIKICHFLFIFRDKANSELCNYPTWPFFRQLENLVLHQSEVQSNSLLTKLPASIFSTTVGLKIVLLSCEKRVAIVAAGEHLIDRSLNNQLCLCAVQMTDPAKSANLNREWLTISHRKLKHGLSAENRANHRLVWRALSRIARVHPWFKHFGLNYIRRASNVNAVCIFTATIESGYAALNPQYLITKHFFKKCLFIVSCLPLLQMQEFPFATHKVLNNRALEIHNPITRIITTTALVSPKPSVSPTLINLLTTFIKQALQYHLSILVYLPDSPKIAVMPCNANSLLHRVRMTWETAL